MRELATIGAPHDSHMEPLTPGITRASTGNQRTSSTGSISALHTASAGAAISICTSIDRRSWSAIERIMVVVLFCWSFFRLRGLAISDLNAPRHFDASVGSFDHWQCWNQLKLCMFTTKKGKTGRLPPPHARNPRRRFDGRRLLTSVGQTPRSGVTYVSVFELL